MENHDYRGNIMLKDLLKDINDTTYYEIPIFNGLMIIRGKILSPAQIEQASLATSLLMRGLMSQVDQIQKISSSLKDNPSEQDIDQAYSMLAKLRPEQVTKITEQQDLTICNSIMQARSSDSDTFERIKIVMHQDQADHQNNLLWVGSLSSQDRQSILDKAMRGHQEALERIASFRR